MSRLGATIGNGRQKARLNAPLLFFSCNYTTNGYAIYHSIMSYTDRDYALQLAKLTSSTKVQNPRRCSCKDKHLKEFHSKGRKYLRGINYTASILTTITHYRASNSRRGSGYWSSHIKTLVKLEHIACARTCNECHRRTRTAKGAVLENMVYRRYGKNRFITDYF